MQGRFDGRWLDTTLLATWSVAALLTAFAAARMAGAPQLLTSEQLVSGVSLGFLLLSAVRLLAWRERKAVIVPAACAVSYLLTWAAVWAGRMSTPQIGTPASACLSGFLLSVASALSPSPLYVWRRIRPVPRPTRPRPPIARSPLEGH